MDAGVLTQAYDPPMTLDTTLIDDLRGLSRLAVRGVAETTGLVEHMHATIARGSAPIGGPAPDRTRGITGLVYRSIHGVTGLVGGSLDLGLGLVAPAAPATTLGGPRRDRLIAILNGIVGDHLADTDNPLALAMRFRHRGQALALEPGALADALERPSNHLLISVHGLCMSDHCWTPPDPAPDTDRDAVDLPDALAAATDASRVDLHYNSGRAISTNGREFAGLIERLIEHWPVPVTEITLLGHSMGGLVSRSACHHAMQAGHQWPDRLGRMIFLGTPHHGSPLERAGHGLERVLGISPYSAPFNRLGRIRSAGIIDLRHGRILASPNGPEHPPERPPIPAQVTLHAIAATTAARIDHPAARLLGDGLVPIDSALGRHPDPARHLPIAPEHRHIVPNTTHTGLLHSRRVLEALRSSATRSPMIANHPE